MQVKVTLTILLIGLTSVLANHVEQDRKLICDKKVSTPIAIPYASLVCGAKIFGVNLNGTNVKLPANFVRAVDQRVANVEILKNVDSFHNWFCKDVNGSATLLKNEPKFNFTDEQMPIYWKCFNDKISEIIQNEICQKKNIIAQKLEGEKLKCLTSTLGKNNKCLNELFGKKIELNQLNDWLCLDIVNVEKFSSSEIICAMSTQQLGDKYGDCMDKALENLVKN